MPERSGRAVPKAFPLPLLLSIPAFLAAPGVRAQATLPAGGEFRVNQYTTGSQQRPAIAVGPDGSYFLVWESQFQDGSGSGVFGRRYDRAGAPLGPEFQVTQSSASDQAQPSVAADGAGRYTVVWTSPDASGLGIFARQFTSAGPLADEFPVNTYVTGDQTNPRVAAGPDGVAVVWQSAGQDGQGAGVFGRLFSQLGLPAGNEVLLSTVTSFDQTLPVVAALPNQRFVVAWRDASVSSVPHVWTRLFDRLLVPLGPGTQIPESPQAFPYSRRENVNVVSMGLGTYSVGLWEATTWGFKEGVLSYDLGVQVVDHGVDGTPLEPRAMVASGDAGDDARYQEVLAANGRQQLLMAYTSAPGVLVCFGLHEPLPECPIVSPEDGSGSSVFVRSLGPLSNPSVLRVNTFTAGDQSLPDVALDSNGNAIVAWQSSGQDGSGSGIYAQRLGGLFPAALAVDAAGNGVLEPGESAVVAPSWINRNGTAVTAGGALLSYAGPAPGTYTIEDGQGSYGSILDGATQACLNCYTVHADLGGPRPAAHVDTTLVEALTPAAVSVRQGWTLHLGGSFTDVPSSSPFYRFAETLLHRGVTSGCGATTFCPGATTTREQMAVFVLVSKEGTSYVPPACTGRFDDVPASSPFCRWVEELARRGVTGGCGGGNFCPTASVTREQMAVFVLRTLDPALSPPACTTPLFGDVPASSAFCRWVEEMARRGITGGCGGGNFCPTAAVTREQMAVFLAGAFGLTLYGA